MSDSAISYLAARGCVYKTTSQKASGGTGFYALSPALSSAGNYPVLLTGAAVEKSDLVAPMPLLNNQRVFYVFGQDFGNVVVTGEILLGPSGGIDPAGNVALLNSYFQANRVSNSQNPITLSMGSAGAVARFALTGIRVMEAIKEYHILPFALIGITVDN